MEPSKEAFSQPSVGPVEGQDFSDLVDGKMEEPGSKKKQKKNGVCVVDWGVGIQEACGKKRPRCIMTSPAH